MQKYIEVKDNSKGVTHIKVSVFYDIGGASFNTYQNKPRGYYISVIPVTREEKNGYTTECIGAYSGLKKLLKAVQRKSAKAEAEAEKQAELLIDVMVSFICDKNGLELLETEE